MCSGGSGAVVVSLMSYDTFSVGRTKIYLLQLLEQKKCYTSPVRKTLNAKLSTASKVKVEIAMVMRPANDLMRLLSHRAVCIHCHNLTQHESNYPRLAFNST